MKRLLSVLGLFCFFTNTVRSQQVDCANMGFETGTALGWVLTSGTLSAANQRVNYLNEVMLTVENGHYVTSLSDGNDPKIVDEKIPMVAPGSKHSIRIGNTTRGGTFDRIKTSFMVTPENTLFQYQFAAVLQNDNTHNDYQKPGLTIQIEDSDGQPLTCNTFAIQLQRGATVEGFKTQGDLEYKNWTTGAIDLRNYIGKVIKIEVTAHGCTERRHFGYAYFDAQCIKSEIKVTAFCPDPQGYMTLKAPEGFETYTWDNNEKTSSVRVQANLGDVYSVKIAPLDKLDESCLLQLDYKIKYYNADTLINAVLCEGESFTVDNKVYTQSGTYVNTIRRRDVCDSTIRLNLKIIPIAHHTQSFVICQGKKVTVGDSVYSKTGTYINHIILRSGCDSIVTTHLLVEDLQFEVTGAPQTIVEGDSVQLAVAVQPAGNNSFQWSPPNGLSCSTCSVTWAHPSKTTEYTVFIKNASQACQKSDTITLSVLPCNIYIPDIFSPNNDQQNDVFFVYGNSCAKQIKEMTVYDRWGEVIYHKENIPFSDPQHGWDGRYLGNMAGTGVYTYKISVEFRNGKSNRYSGAITLLR
ncbi:MAG: gliding motility-associated C-terminal domain-containing protein [Spirosomataceae bacterium]